MKTSPSSNIRTTRVLRLLGIGTGILALIWLPREDTSLVWVFALSVLIASLLTASFIAWLFSATHLPNWTSVLLGALGGSLVGLISIVLMAIKTGLHGHSVPDFTAVQVKTALASTPLWCIVGALAGGSAAWLRRKE